MDGPYEDLIRPNDWSLTGTETSYGTTSPPHLIRLTIEGPFNPVGVSETATRRRTSRAEGRLRRGGARCTVVRPDGPARLSSGVAARYSIQEPAISKHEEK